MTHIPPRASTFVPLASYALLPTLHRSRQPQRRHGAGARRPPPLTRRPVCQRGRRRRCRRRRHPRRARPPPRRGCPCLGGRRRLHRLLWCHEHWFRRRRQPHPPPLWPLPPSRRAPPLYPLAAHLWQLVHYRHRADQVQHAARGPRGDQRGGQANDVPALFTPSGWR